MFKHVTTAALALAGLATAACAAPAERTEQRADAVYWHQGTFRDLPRRSGDLALTIEQLAHENTSAGYTAFDATRAAAFEQFVTTMLSTISANRSDGNAAAWCPVRELAAQAGYKIERFYDTVTGRWFVIAEDVSGTGQAHFVVNPYHHRDVVVEVPHEAAPREGGEAYTDRLGAELLRGLAARALIVNRAHRCAASAAATCRVPTSEEPCAGGYRLSDVAHNANNAFHVLHQRFNATASNRFVQLHGWGTATELASVSDTSNRVGASVANTFAAGLRTRPLPSGYSGANVYSCQEGASPGPCGTFNLQGRYTNDPARESCNGLLNADNTVSTDRFLHLELAMAMRNTVEGRAAVRDALATLWPCRDGTTTCTLGPTQDAHATDPVNPSCGGTTTLGGDRVQYDVTRWPTASAPRYSSPFGPRWHASDMRYDFHRGIDIPGARGDAIYPIAPGRVYRAFPSGSPSWPSSGNLVIIEHTADAPVPAGNPPSSHASTRYYSLYFHLQSVSVTQDQQLTTTTTPIGTMGDSGASYVHLHLEIRVGTTCSYQTCPAQGYDPHVNPFLLLDYPNNETLAVEVVGTSPLRVRVTSDDEELDVNSIVVRQGTTTRTFNMNTREGLDLSDVDNPSYNGITVTPTHYNEASTLYETVFEFTGLTGYDSIEVRDIWGAGKRLTP